MKDGYLFVVDGERWVNEVSYAIKRLRVLTHLPICIVCSNNSYEIEYLRSTFDNIIVKVVEDIKKANFLSKVIGMNNSPFQNTLYMDTDTFVVRNIDKIFNLLDLCDIALKIEASIHTSLFPIKDDFKDFLPEYNTGVVLFKNSEVNKNFFSNWERAMLNKVYSEDYFDMPQFRNAFLHSEVKPVIFTLSENFNMSGLRSYKIIHGEVKIIHERFGTFWFSHSERMLDNECMMRIAKRINKSKQKRIFIPYFNMVISTQKISITYLIKRLKIKLGFIKIRKDKAF